MKEFSIKIASAAGVFTLQSDEKGKELIKENILKCIKDEQVAFYSNENGQHLIFPSELIRNSVITISEHYDQSDEIL